MDVSEAANNCYRYRCWCLQVLQLLLDSFQVLFPVLYCCWSWTSVNVIYIFLRCITDGIGVGILEFPVKICLRKSTLIDE